jgi:hypothetical protein
LNLLQQLSSVHHSSRREDDEISSLIRAAHADLYETADALNNQRVELAPAVSLHMNSAEDRQRLAEAEANVTAIYQKRKVRVHSSNLLLPSHWFVCLARLLNLRFCSVLFFVSFRSTPPFKFEGPSSLMTVPWTPLSKSLTKSMRAAPGPVPI